MSQFNRQPGAVARVEKPAMSNRVQHLQIF
jgi:hypothetical protein